MLKTHWRVISRLERVADNALIIAAFFLSYYLRDPVYVLAQQYSLVAVEALPKLAPIEEYLIVLGSSLPLFNAILSLFGAYRSMRFVSYLKVFRVTFGGAFLVFLALGSVLYLLKLDLSRSFVGIFCAVSALGLFAVRLFVLAALRIFRTQGRNYRNLMIVGTGHQACELYREILRTPELGVKVVGFTELEGAEGKYSSEVYDLGARVVADVDSFEAALKKYAVDEVLFTDVIQAFAAVNELARIAVEEGVRVTLAADLFSLNIFKSDMSYFGTTPLIHYNPSPAIDNIGALAAKRMLDLLISLLALTVLSPLMLLTALAIKIDSRGPVYFRQRRVGLNGRTFVLLKFRSMIDGAEKMLPELREHNEMDGPVFKIRNDPRITRIGKIIRRLSIDELPQLFNVLRGDMSLVGPRPPLPEEVSLYLRKHRRRLSMRPGLTCIWQVSGRNEIPNFETWAELDLEYIDNWSLWTDFKLLARTIPAVLSGAGAR